jgi:hypothetical protein
LTTREAVPDAHRSAGVLEYKPSCEIVCGADDAASARQELVPHSLRDGNTIDEKLTDIDAGHGLAHGQIQSAVVHVERREQPSAEELWERDRAHSLEDEREHVVIFVAVVECGAWLVHKRGSTQPINLIVQRLGEYLRPRRQAARRQPRALVHQLLGW